MRRGVLPKSREKIGLRRLRMLRPLDKVSPFKIDPLVIALSFTHSGPMNRCQDCKGGDRKSRSSRRPIPREDVFDIHRVG